MYSVENRIPMIDDNKPMAWRYKPVDNSLCNVSCSYIYDLCITYIL